MKVISVVGLCEEVDINWDKWQNINCDKLLETADKARVVIFH